MAKTDPKPSNTDPRLEQQLGYRFADRRLLIQALTHRSLGRPNNERLEYLGDSILGFYVAQALFLRYRDQSEGELTRMRANLINRPTLGALARELELPQHLKTGPGERNSDLKNRDSALSDALEALIGAVYLDGGIAAVFALLDRIYAPLLAHEITQIPEQDSKSALQEYLQKQGQALPLYELVRQEGTPHVPIFVVSCTLSTHAEPFFGTERTRKAAEQMAAGRALDALTAGATGD